MKYLPSPSGKRRTCNTCVFYFSWDLIGKNGVGTGECRRCPPVVVLLPKSIGGSTDRATPVVGQGYWCGEHQFDFEYERAREISIEDISTED